ncbi:MAG: nucleotide exchange factor GrpE [Bacteroidota bacterium]
MQKDLTDAQDTQQATSSPEKKSDKKETTAQALKKAEEELAAAHDKYLRLYSEFENFRRRAAKEKLLLVETASEGVLVKLLTIVDDFERALASLQTTDTTIQATQEGIQLIYDKLLQLLQQAGVQPMSIEKGTPFDTEFHEAVTQVPTEDAQMKGKVIDVIEKGYLLKEKILRFAKVVTGS